MDKGHFQHQKFLFLDLFFATIEIPEINPPPPIGTTIQSSSFIFSNISMPILPWPEITS